MESIYSYTSYKKFIKNKIRALPAKGRGETQRIADFIRVNPSFISQVLNGDKHFSSEQLFGISHYFSLTSTEKDFLLTLLSYERAGTVDLSEYYKGKLEELRKKSKFVRACE